jgi:K+/H+ antiporter YhaU regulatory subunit KhtT
MTSRGMQPMGMFELAPVGIPIAVVGLLYMFFIGRRMIPDRVAPEELTEEFGLQPYLTEILILPDSPLIGETLAESGLGQKLDLTVIRVVREKHNYLEPRADLKLEEDDVLLVEGLRDNILKVKDTSGLDIKADVKLSDPDLETDDIHLAEGMVMPRSALIGRTLKGIGFRERYHLQVLAVNRSDETFIARSARSHCAWEMSCCYRATMITSGRSSGKILYVCSERSRNGVFTHNVQKSPWQYLLAGH